jgi:hypothetical protein
MKSPMKSPMRPMRPARPARQTWRLRPLCEKRCQIGRPVGPVGWWSLWLFTDFSSFDPHCVFVCVQNLVRCWFHECFTGGKHHKETWWNMFIWTDLANHEPSPPQHIAFIAQSAHCGTKQGPFLKPTGHIRGIWSGAMGERCRGSDCGLYESHVAFVADLSRTHLRLSSSSLQIHKVSSCDHLDQTQFYHILPITGGLPLCRLSDLRT